MLRFPILPVSERGWRKLRRSRRLTVPGWGWSKAPRTRPQMGLGRGRRRMLGSPRKSYSRYAHSAVYFRTELSEAGQGLDDDHSGSEPDNVKQSEAQQHQPTRIYRGEDEPIEDAHSAYIQLTPPERRRFADRLVAIYGHYRPDVAGEIIHYRSHLHAKTLSVQDLQNGRPLREWKDAVQVASSHSLGRRTETRHRI